MPLGGLVTGGLISAGGSLLGGLFGSRSAKKAGEILQNAGNAAATSTNATTTGNQQMVAGATQSDQGHIDDAKNQALQAREGAWNQQQDRLSPWLQAGDQGITAYSSAMAPGGDLTKQFTAPTAEEVERAPGYQFQAGEGLKAIQRSAAAAGSLGSGGTAKALDQYTQGLASTYYQNAFNNALTGFQTNRNNTFQGLSALAGFGQNANALYNQGAQNFGNGSAGDITSAASQYANLGQQGAEFSAQIGQQGNKTANDYMLQGAGGSAAGTVGAGNAWQNAFNGVGKGLGSIFAPTASSNPWNTGGGTNSTYAGNPIQNSNGTWSGGAGPAMPPSWTPPVDGRFGWGIGGTPAANSVAPDQMGYSQFRPPANTPPPAAWQRPQGR